MIARLALAAVAAMGLATAAPAFDLSEMTEDERATFRAEIRAYLLENPEVLMEAIAVLDQREREAQVANDQALVASYADDLFDDGHSWVGGNPDGDITIVEFMDYRCGFCKRAYTEVETLLETDGNIRFIVKEFPILGEESMLASRFAIATQQTLGDDAYKSVHDALIAFNGAITEDALSRIADTLGLDAASILDHMDSDQVTEVIRENHALAQRLSISGTPSFVMANQMLRGYAPAQDMQRMADEIRTQ